MSAATSGAASTKPYLIRAIYEWCGDNGFTPYLAVRVDARTRVPMGYVKDGAIVLNIGVAAVRDLRLDNDYISFSGRFGGAAHEILVPVGAVTGIYARENGQGLAFEVVEGDDEPPAPDDGGNAAEKGGRSHLRVIK